MTDTTHMDAAELVAHLTARDEWQTSPATVVHTATVNAAEHDRYGRTERARTWTDAADQLVALAASPHVYRGANLLSLMRAYGIAS